MQLERQEAWSAASVRGRRTIGRRQGRTYLWGEPRVTQTQLHTRMSRVDVLRMYCAEGHLGRPHRSLELWWCRHVGVKGMAWPPNFHQPSRRSQSRRDVIFVVANPCASLLRPIERFAAAQTSSGAEGREARHDIHACPLRTPTSKLLTSSSAPRQPFCASYTCRAGVSTVPTPAHRPPGTAH
ncbi:hypothetical protein BDU57DRAFT_92078 [Ampelomyces quisqualis]|uniref:Uncharacterized protein n=1 Tax=Ampelomyces quisqualis TaxID=50730 RepID=A0A6A5Q7Y1_AMPQU|nr:hypothetical protein BDU57DRAFT_92078 [Ampelomyces quisqualis]